MSDWVDLVGIVSLGVNSVFVNCFGDYVYCLFNKGRGKKGKDF